MIVGHVFQVICCFVSVSSVAKPTFTNHFNYINHTFHDLPPLSDLVSLNWHLLITQKGTDVCFAGSEEKGFCTFSMGFASHMFMYFLMGMFPGLHASFDKCTITGVKVLRMQDILSRTRSELLHCMSAIFCLCHLWSGIHWEWLYEEFVIGGTEKISQNPWTEDGQNNQMDVQCFRCPFLFSLYWALNLSLSAHLVALNLSLSLCTSGCSAEWD